MKFSEFGERYSASAGIVQLMEDLGEAMSGGREFLMLGGGNPAHIPEVQTFLRERLQRIAEDPAEFAQVIGNYDHPRGDTRFTRALVDLLNDQYGWGIGPENVVLTSGSQTGFFMLFNLFAGGGGAGRRILLPMMPEYIGYADIGLERDFYVSRRPSIETFDDRSFKYHVNFDEVSVDDSIGAISVSRPTNPTGNVLTDSEINRLHDLARSHDVPLILDNAYGMPFPSIIFTEVELPWSDHVILCMSLSKLGLPGVRTGIIIGPEAVTTAIARMNAIFNLAVGSIGPALVYDLVHSGEVLTLSRNVIRPYYERKSRAATELFHRYLDGVDFFIHKTEGALFLWLWCPGLPITSEELYRRLKQRGVLVLSGHYFFPGLREDWRHRHECLRVSYAMPDDVVERGIAIIAEEVKKAFAGG